MHENTRACARTQAALEPAPVKKRRRRVDENAAIAGAWAAANIPLTSLEAFQQERRRRQQQGAAAAGGVATAAAAAGHWHFQGEAPESAQVVAAVTVQAVAVAATAAAVPLQQMRQLRCRDDDVHVCVHNRHAYMFGIHVCVESEWQGKTGKEQTSEGGQWSLKQ